QFISSPLGGVHGLPSGHHCHVMTGPLWRQSARATPPSTRATPLPSHRDTAPPPSHRELTLEHRSPHENPTPEVHPGQFTGQVPPPRKRRVARAIEPCQWAIPGSHVGNLTSTGPLSPCRYPA